jgi:hypothetical protein
MLPELYQCWDFTQANITRVVDIWSGHAHTRYISCIESKRSCKLPWQSLFYMGCINTMMWCSTPFYCHTPFAQELWWTFHLIEPILDITSILLVHVNLLYKHTGIVTMQFIWCFMCVSMVATTVFFNRDPHDDMARLSLDAFAAFCSRLAISICCDSNTHGSLQVWSVVPILLLRYCTHVLHNHRVLKVP